MQTDIDKLTEAGINVVGISYDSIEVLKAYSDKKGLSLTLLSDQGSKTIDAFGIRNTAMDGKTYGSNDLSGVPHPGTYLVDSQGVVKAKLFLEKYEERHTTDALIEAAKNVTAE